MDNLQTVAGDLLFRLSNTTLLDIVDLALVTLSFYLLFSFLRRSQSALILRGALLLAVVFLIASIILPLPVFDRILQVTLVVFLVALPVTMQPELRRWLERIGRGIGLTPSLQQSFSEQITPTVLRAVENLSAGQIGALIVVEGATSLQSVIDSGVALDGEVSAELLLTIFQDKTPLHDGAVVIRDNRIVAAGCVLPLTERQLSGRRRLGTRHRAAVGLSEATDALIIVVSEETGAISVAHQEKLQQNLDSNDLRQQLYQFYSAVHSSPAQAGERLWRSLRETVARPFRSPPSPRQLLANLAYLLLAYVLAILVWSVVVEQTDPTARLQINGVPLRLEGQPAETVIISPVPENVTVEAQTTSTIAQELGPEDFTATLDLSAAVPGEQTLPVQVQTDASPLRIIQITPPEVKVTLARLVAKEVAVEVLATDETAMSPAYELVGAPQARPDTVTVYGPEHLVAQVARAQATVSLAGATAPFRELRPVYPVAGDGSAVNEVTLTPGEVEVSVNIRRLNNARDVGVQVVTTGNPLQGYWLSNISAEPAAVTLRGDPQILSDIGNVVKTLPVDISGIAGTARISTPLDIPDTVRAVDSAGLPVSVVEATITTSPLRGDLVLQRRVTPVGAPPGYEVIVEPAIVTLLLSGPMPTLADIEQLPDLVHVTVDAGGMLPGQSRTLTPQVVLPPDVQAQLVEPTVRVSIIP